MIASSYRWALLCVLISFALSSLPVANDLAYNQSLDNAAVAIIKSTFWSGLFLSLWFPLSRYLGSIAGFMYGSIVFELFIVLPILSLPSIFPLIDQSPDQIALWKVFIFYGVSPISTILIQWRIFPAIDGGPLLKSNRPSTVKDRVEEAENEVSKQKRIVENLKQRFRKFLE